MWRLPESDNPFLAEDALTCSLSGRLQSKLCSTIFNLKRDEVVNMNDHQIGLFRGVPDEIKHQIFHQLDLASLAKLACTSKGMGSVVRSLPELRRLLIFAPDAMRAVTAAKVGHRLVCSDMYSKLLEPYCDDCIRPGEYLHLLSCSRLCFRCLSVNPRYRALRPVQAVEQYCPSLRDVRNLPVLVVPRYSMEGYKLRRRNRRLQINTTGWKLIDKDVERLSIETHGAIDEAQLLASERLTELRSRHGSSMTNEDWLELSMGQRRNDLMTRSRHYRMSWAGVRREDLGRLGAHILPDVESAYSVSTLFPWFDMAEDYFGRPHFCKTCHDDGLPLHECYYTEPGRNHHMEKHAT